MVNAFSFVLRWPFFIRGHQTFLGQEQAILPPSQHLFLLVSQVIGSGLDSSGLLNGESLPCISSLLAVSSRGVQEAMAFIPCWFVSYSDTRWAVLVSILLLFLIRGIGDIYIECSVTSYRNTTVQVFVLNTLSYYRLIGICFFSR